VSAPFRVDAVRIALLACLLCPAAALGQEWTDFSRDYHREVIALLRRLASTRGHAAFILDSRIPLDVTDNPTRVDDNVQAAYDLVDRRIYVDEVRLMEGAEELLDQGAPQAVVAEVLAWKTLPTIAHEITHAITHRELERRLGRRFILPCLESEMLSFYDELMVQHELFRERPKLWAPEKILKIERSYGESLLAWKHGRPALDAMIRDIYDGTPELLAAPKEDLVAAVDRRIEQVSQSLAELRRQRGRAGARGGQRRDEVVHRDFSSESALIVYAESTAEMLRETRGVIDDERSWRQTQDYFRAQLAQRRERLESLRGELR
jgi:hypothetical protein